MIPRVQPSANTIRGLAFVGAVLSLAGLLGAAWAGGLWEGDHDIRSAASVISSSEDRGPPAVQAPDARPPEPQEFQTITGVGFDRAPATLPVAIDLMPFEVRLPSYVPDQLRLAHVAANIAGREGILEIDYTLPPNGKPLPSLRMNWSPADSSAPEPIQPFSDKGTFTARGREWRYYVVNWRDYDTVEARSVSDAGIQEFAEIRVIGMDSTTALAELQKVISSAN